MPTSPMPVAPRYWSAHTHSRHSVDDALSPVPELVVQAHALGYPAFGLVDHGTMAGVHAGYTTAKKLGLPFAPGCEMYITPDHASRDRRVMHLTLLAYTSEGYRNLVALHNQAHRQVFNRKPRLDFADLAAAAEAGRTSGIACGTGCRSGPVLRSLVDREDVTAASQIVNALATWFPRTYVEVMNHGFRADGMHDDQIEAALVEIAEATGLPMILTGDAHYTHPEEKELHDALKVLVTFSPDPEDGKFSGAGYWLASTEDMAHHKHGWEGLEDLASAIKVTIPELDTFSLKIPDVTFGKDPMNELKLACMARHNELAETVTKAELVRIKDRTMAEWAVIDATGMAPYLLLVKMITDFMEERGIWFYARGSVAGSRVCYDLGISNTDPIFWDIRFDRFLSGDRTSVPDIDLDIEHERRNEVMAMLEEAGYELVQVGTQATYGLDAEEDTETGEGQGSLRVKYYGALRKQGLEAPPWNEVSAEDKRRLYALARRDREPQERLVSGVGAHPGGYVVARDKPTVASLPIVQIASSSTFVTAFVKGEVEAMGFPKIDLLGSKVLTAVKEACMLATGSDEKEAKKFWRAIPLNDPATMKRVADGNTTGLFQLGGWTNRQGMIELRPRKTSDIVAGQALFRPAPLNAGFTKTYLARRFKEIPVPVMHADIAAETKDTYGIAIYQEQVVGLMRRIGLSPEQLTKMLKAVKASGKTDTATAKKIVADAIGGIVEMAKARGWGEDDITYLESALIDYGAGYSFGKAHSVTYGVSAYVTAFLATNHPLGYWTGMLNAYRGAENAKGEKLEPMYWRVARKDGLRIADAHVNRSELRYTSDPERNMIVKGLTSIPQVGEPCAAELIAKRPFTSIIDLASRVNGKVAGAKLVLAAQTLEEAFFQMVPEIDPNTGRPTGRQVEKKREHALASLYHHGALKDIPFGTPIRRAKGRKRKCEECKITYPTPLEYEDHVEEVHGAGDAQPEGQNST